MQSAYQCLEIKGELLLSAYAVYVIEIINKKAKYYYVGQTGDAKVISARSPFYRLAAHLGYSKSTQNQIYKGLSSKLSLSSRGDMEKWFRTATIRMHYFKTNDFAFLDSAIEGHLALHHKLRRKTLIHETAVIKKLGVKYSDRLLNRAKVTYREIDISSDRFSRKVFRKLGLKEG
jgi:hypothetical protein